MSVIIALIIIDTIAQVIVCHFSLWWFIALVARILFCARIVGATFKVKKLAIAEGVAFGCMFLWNMLFSGDSFPWQKLIFFFIFSLLAVGLEYLDDLLYVYVIEDLEDD